MTDLELIFIMLGESSTTALTKKENSQWMCELSESAKKRGNVAKVVREKLEKDLGESVISNENYLDLEKDNKKHILK